MKKTLLALTIFLVTALSGMSQLTINHNYSGGCAPATVQFTVAGLGGGLNYSWSFSDGTSSSATSPTKTFATPGQYFIDVYVWSNTSGYSDNGYITIEIPGGSGQIGMSNDTACINDEVSFWSNGTADSYSIDFGDGSPVESNTWGSFYHEYTTAGPKYITYTYTTAQCGNQVVLDTVHVGSNLPVTDAYIQLDPHTACVGDEISFWTNWGYNWIIDFGDGNTSNNEYTHTYASTGTYVVTATVQNGCGNIGTAVDTVVIDNNVPINSNVYFWFPPTSCPNSEVDLGAPSGYSSYSWDFGNGQTSADQYPSIEFPTVGQYPVALTIANGCGNDTTIYNTIDISNSVYVNQAQLDMVDSVCLGETFQFDVDGGNIDTYEWNLGDGTFAYTESGAHTYASGGIFFINCTVSNGCDNDTTLYGHVYVGTDVGINASNLQYSVFPDEACPGDTVTYVAFPGGTASTYLWYFGDGDSSSNTDIIEVNNEVVFDILDHAYASNGTYTIHFHATNTCGFTFHDSMEIVIGPGATPEASILFNEDSYNCLGAELIFKGIGGSVLNWNFGDGTGNLIDYGTLEPIPHTYTNPGTYEVSLEVTNNCGISDQTSVEVFIPDNAMTLVTTTVKSHCGQSDGKAIVSVSGGEPPYLIQWSDGSTGNIAEDLSAGIYFVSVQDANGCWADAVATVSDQEAPTIVLSAQVDVSCNGDNDGALDVNLIGSSAPYEYSWSSGSASEDINNLIAGPYELLVEDANGCIATESFEITEPDPVFVSFSNTPSDCGMDNGTATINVNGNTGPYVYSWDNGISNETVTGLGPGVYGASVIDVNGCLYSGITTVSEKNAPYIILDSIVQVGCGGSVASIYINPIGSTGPYDFLWTDGSTNEDLINVPAGEYAVKVTGANGCESVDHFVIEEFNPDPTQICMVTVDPLSNTNKVVWEKDFVDPAISSFNIYKESSQSGVYFLIGNQPVDSLSEYVDYFSDPVPHAWRYRITAVDSCGNESVSSSHHKTIHLTSNIGVGGVINLIWDGYIGFSFNTYNIWRYSDIDGWNMITSLQHTLSSYTDASPPVGATSLHYYLEAVPNNPCVSTRASHNTTRSNKSSPVAGDITSSIAENELLDVLVYPNPTNGTMFIDLDNRRFQSAELMDGSGKICLSTPINSNITEINMQGLERGVYFLRIEGTDNVITKKIILSN